MEIIEEREMNIEFYLILIKVRSASSNETCLDLNNMLVGAPLLLWRCTKGENQFFAWTKSGQITMAEEYCVGVDHKKHLLVVRCNETDSSQLWTYNNEVSKKLTLYISNS